MANFPQARAQFIHFDHLPQDVQDEDWWEALCISQGSVLVAAHPTKLILYPGSHRLGSGEIFKPVIVPIPAGCMILFTTIAHAGYGIWDQRLAHMVPCPHMDDWMALDSLSLQKRGHVYVDRGIPVPWDTTVPRALLPDHAKKFLLENHSKKLEVFNPIIFAPTEKLTYDCLPLNQSAEDLQSEPLMWEDRQFEESMGAIFENMVQSLKEKAGETYPPSASRKQKTERGGPPYGQPEVHFAPQPSTKQTTRKLETEPQTVYPTSSDSFSSDIRKRREELQKREKRVEEAQQAPPPHAREEMPAPKERPKKVKPSQKREDTKEQFRIVRSLSPPAEGAFPSREFPIQGEGAATHKKVERFTKHVIKSKLLTEQLTTIHRITAPEKEYIALLKERVTLLLKTATEESPLESGTVRTSLMKKGIYNIPSGRKYSHRNPL